jgi:hypothetical protein
VIPGSVAVIALNTMYFFDSNKGTFLPASILRAYDGADAAVGGCEFKEKVRHSHMQHVCRH